MPGRSVLIIVWSAAAAAALLPKVATAGPGDRAPGERVTGQPAAVTVEETDQLQFQPSSVHVARGDAVAWTNPGSVPHNVTFDRYPGLTSGTMYHGDRHEIRFTVPGTYQYRCTFHPGMTGTVMVSPASSMRSGGSRNVGGAMAGVSWARHSRRDR